ncbi:MAG: MMPL family transporter [Deltaproteobacteria bacterium]|nr:MMPL family transporter [Deltaproteobacteria bacterium]
MRFSYQAWAALIERRHRAIILGSLIACGLAALSLTRLRLDIDVLGMLPQGTPAFDDFKSFVADFGELNELVVLLEGAPPERLQSFADEFASRLSQLDTVGAVHARINVQAVLDGLLGRYLYNYVPEADYAELADRLTPAGIEAQVAADRAVLSAPFDLSAARAVVQDPLGFRRLAAGALAQSYRQAAPAHGSGYLMSADGQALLLLVRPRAAAFDIDFSGRLMQQVQAAEAQVRRALAAEAVRVAYTGSYVYALEDAATLKGDIGRYTGLALCGVLAVFYAGYRNFRILPFVTYPLMVTTLLTFALSLLLFEQLNGVSLSFAAILYGLSIDSGIHFYARLLQERQRAECRNVTEAVTATLAGLGRANVAGTATTAAAFFVIAFSVLGAVRQLGILTGLGMLLTTLEFFTLYPALGFFFMRRAQAGGTALAAVRLERCAAAAARRAGAVSAAALLLAVALLVIARHVELDVTLTHLRPRASTAAQVQDEIAARFGEPGTGAAILVRRPELERALSDAEEVARHLRRYQEQGLLRSVQSVGALLPSARVQQARLDRYNQLPRTAAIAELRAALARHGFVPERFGEFLADFERPRHELVAIGNPALVPVAQSIDHHVRERAGEYTVATYCQPAAGASWRALAERVRGDLAPMAITVAARALLEEELGRVLRRELTMFFVFGLAANLLLLWLSFGDLRTAAVILTPVLFALAAVFAVMAAAGMALDPVNLIVVPLIFGIGVDYGVYLVACSREQASIAAAVRVAGRAVATTALTTIAGFGFLGLSRYPPLSALGLLAGGGLLLCVLLSIILLPALMTFVPGSHRGD